jgi:hypothetical protein
VSHFKLLVDWLEAGTQYIERNKILTVSTECSFLCCFVGCQLKNSEVVSLSQFVLCSECSPLLKWIISSSSSCSHSNSSSSNIW